MLQPAFCDAAYPYCDMSSDREASVPMKAKRPGPWSQHGCCLRCWSKAPAPAYHEVAERKAGRWPVAHPTIGNAAKRRREAWRSLPARAEASAAVSLLAFWQRGSAFTARAARSNRRTCRGRCGACAATISKTKRRHACLRRSVPSAAASISSSIARGAATRRWSKAARSLGLHRFGSNRRIAGPA